MAVLACAAIAPAAHASSLRYYGNGVNDIDRVKIRIDDPADNNPGPPADVGATDFTLEFWVRSNTDNQAGAINCGFNNNWITGNIIIDRDRFAQPREWGISMGAGRIAFGVSNASFTEFTVCGSTDIRDNQWHHVAVQRRRSDGRLWIWVDGSLEAEQDGPDGDISYPDDGVPLNLCGPSGSASCTFSDPFIVIGAEKHDAPSAASFSGWVDEFRISTSLRYLAPFTPPGQPFTADSDTAALYHFDEGSGTAIGDAAFGSASPGVRSVGGSPAGPEWVADTPFSGSGSPGSVQFSMAAYAGSEPGSTVTINVTRSGGSSGAVTVDYASSDGSAVAGADYSAVSGTLSWPDGNTLTRSFDVTVLDDQQVEGSETVNLALSNPTGGVVIGSTGAATLTIADDDATVPGDLRLSAATYSVGEADGSVTVSVRRVGGSDGAVGVSYSVSGGTAVAGADYGATSGTLNWANGDVADKSFVIPVFDDADGEGNETANVSLTSPTGGAGLANPSTAVLTIVDDDTAQPGDISLASSAYSVSEAGTSITITVNRSNGSDGSASVDYTVASGTAQAGTDFVQTSGTLSWSDGDGSSRTFDIVVTDDTDVEGDETASIELSNVVGANAGAVQTAGLTIVDDDAPSAGTLQLASASVSVGEGGGTLQLTVTRSGGSSGAVTVAYATADETALAGLDYQAAVGQLQWADGDATSRTVNITIIDDTTVEAVETLRLELTMAGGGAALGTPAVSRLSINDNDSPPPAAQDGGGGAVGLPGLLFAILAWLRSRSLRVTPASRFGRLPR